MSRIITEKNDLVPKLLDLFCLYSIDGLTISTISEATGLGKGSIYYFFPMGKLDILEFLIKKTEIYFHTRIDSFIEKKDQIEKSLEEFFEFVETDKEFKIFFHFVSVMALSRFQKVYLKNLRSMNKELTTKMAILVHKKNSSNRKSWELAQNMIGTIYGSLLILIITGDKKIFSENIRNLKKNVFIQLKLRIIK